MTQNGTNNNNKSRKRTHTSTSKDNKRRKVETPNTRRKNRKQTNPKEMEEYNTIVQWNICGLRGKIPELQLMVNQFNPRVIALQETLFDDTKYVDKLDQQRYKWYILPGANASKNGVALAIDKNTPHKQIQLKTNLQAIACKTLGKNKMTYVSIYIPPRKITPVKLKAELTKLIKQLPKPFMLLGDFNSHSTDWGSFKTDRWGMAVQHVINKQGLCLLNDGNSTRVSKNYTCMSVVDLTITSNNNKSIKWTVDTDCRGSDHLPIIITEKKQNKMDEVKPRWDHLKANWEEFQKQVNENIKQRATTSIEMLTEEIHKAAIASIPRKNIKRQKRVPWWNNKVAKAVRQRSIALTRFINHTKLDLKKRNLAKNLRIAKHKATRVIRKAKKKSWEDFIKSLDKDESDSKTLWNKIHALSGKNRKQNIILNDGSRITEDSLEIANKLAEYYHEQSATDQYSRYFKKIKRDKERKKLDLSYTSDKNYNKEFTMEELNNALKNSSGKATGNDEISYEMLRHLPIEAKITLLEEYNKIWKQGSIPLSWKVGIVVPIPKDNNNPHDTKNYRPITLLSCVGKVLERMVNTRLITELEEKRVLNPNQFAFRPGKSTDEYFTVLEGIITPAIQQGKHVEVALLDISKAYDRAWRRPIIEQLQKWNIDGNMIRYIEDFLTDRKFQVEVNNQKSDIKIQENGIPQGAVLSVTLFLIAMNSITKTYRKSNKNVQILVYADDILIIVIGEIKHKIRTQLQKKVTRVYKWARNRGFTIAPHKSKILHICNKYKHSKNIPDIMIEGQIIPQVSYAKLLGVTIDRRLDFKQHCRELRKEINNRCNMIKVIGGRYKGANRATMLNVFKSLVLSKILYGAHFYSKGAQQSWKIIEPAYNQTIRTISGALRTSPVESILAESGMLPLNIHIKLNTITKAIKWLELHDVSEEAGKPLIDRANKFTLEIMNEKLPDIERRPNALGRKWYEPKVKVDTSTTRKLKAGEQRDVAQQVFLETLNKYPNHTKVYTDGSVKDDEVGCGVHNENINTPIKLNKMNTIFSAESYALLTATKMSSNNGEKTIIFTDSASCIAALNKGLSTNPWIEMTQMEAKGKDITFCWIPSHVGIKGNETADQIAEEGRNNGFPYNKVPANDAINWFKERAIWANEYEWRRSSSSFLRQSKPTTMLWKDRKYTKEQRTLTRIRIGHTWLSHGYLLHKEPQPKCSYCNDTLTVDHLIRMCPQYDDIRRKYNIYDLSIYNNTDECETNLLHFLKECKLQNEV